MPDLPHSPADPAISIVPLDHGPGDLMPLLVDLGLTLVHESGERLVFDPTAKALGSVSRHA
jgi:hypothetical protein